MLKLEGCMRFGLGRKGVHMSLGSESSAQYDMATKSFRIVLKCCKARNRLSSVAEPQRLVLPHILPRLARGSKSKSLFVSTDHNVLL
jgi:hypothetical protein